jgi:RHS repeat-associated protein
LDLISWKFTSKELDEETGFYYFGARYLDAEAGRWLSVDPALGEYLNSPTGEGGILNHINLNVYHYSGNNPLTYIDPDGKKQNKAQELISKGLNFILNNAHKVVGNEGAAKIQQVVQSITSISVERDYYEGIEARGEIYFQDKMSVKVGPVPLNSVQVQSKVDYPGTPATDTLPSGSEYVESTEVGRMRPNSTKHWLRETIKITGLYLIHSNWRDGDKPFSQGCVTTVDRADFDETNNIVKQDLKFDNGQKVRIKINDYKQKGEKVNDNIK